jgi:hypothetical protein
MHMIEELHCRAEDICTDVDVSEPRHDLASTYHNMLAILDLYEREHRRRIVSSTEDEDDIQAYNEDNFTEKWHKRFRV